MPPDLTIIILTYNEEINLPYALNSVVGWAKRVIVLDSISTDATVKVAETFECEVVQHPFQNYALQRNYALGLQIDTEWVLFLDADEWMPQGVKEEISSIIQSEPDANGFYLKRRMIWLGRWIRRGYYPTWILRLFRLGKARCEERVVNEHMIIEGPVGFLQNDFIHHDRKSLSSWVRKHNHYATLEAYELIKRARGERQEEIDARLTGTQSERKRWVRHRIWERMPIIIRPFFYFIYRYFFLGGFLDGREAFIYHFLQALWFPLLIDAKYLELKLKDKTTNRKPEDG